MERNEELNDVFSDGSTEANAELRLLTAYPEPMVGNYGTETLGISPGRGHRSHRSFLSRRSNTFRLQDIMTEDAAMHGFPSRSKIQDAQDGKDTIEESEGEYLKSKLWYSLQSYNANGR